jgi:hypothetical protein
MQPRWDVILLKQNICSLISAYGRPPFIHDILDIGGESGRFAVLLHERGFNVVVLEKDHITPS